jgi:hypothetical protein
MLTRARLCAKVGLDKGGLPVPQYDIYVRCVECGAVHPMRIRIHLDNGPLEKQSIAETYPGATRPPQLQAIDGHKTLCLKTGRMFIQENLDHIFLVPSYSSERIT